MRTALILEDLPESQEMLREVAQTAFPGIRCQCVAEVAAALRAISQFQFELALVDLSLPDGDGTAVVEALRTRTPDSLIVVATIFDDDDHLFPALRAGAQGYLLKDQAPEHLVAQLRGIQEGQPPLSPSVARRLLEHFRAQQESPGVEQPLISPDVALTPRESDVLVKLAYGSSIAEIAEVLHLSPHTVGTHVKSIYRKLNISSRAEAALHARQRGLV